MIETENGYVVLWQPSLFKNERRRVANRLSVKQACQRALHECGSDVPSADRVIEAWMLQAPVIELIDHIPSIQTPQQAEAAYRQHLIEAAAFESLCRSTRPSQMELSGGGSSQASGWYAEYLMSPHWTNKRLEAHRRFGGECRACCSTSNLHVHHRHYRTLGDESVIRDLLLLCAVCHFGIHRDHDIRPPKAEPIGLLKGL